MMSVKTLWCKMRSNSLCWCSLMWARRYDAKCGRSRGSAAWLCVTDVDVDVLIVRRMSKSMWLLVTDIELDVGICDGCRARCCDH